MSIRFAGLLCVAFLAVGNSRGGDVFVNSWSLAGPEKFVEKHDGRAITKNTNPLEVLLDIAPDHSATMDSTCAGTWTSAHGRYSADFKDSEQMVQDGLGSGFAVKRMAFVKLRLDASKTVLTGERRAKLRQRAGGIVIVETFKARLAGADV